MRRAIRHKTTIVALPSQTWMRDASIIQAKVLCRETDTGLCKVGDGQHRYSELPYTNPDFTVLCETTKD